MSKKKLLLRDKVKELVDGLDTVKNAMVFDDTPESIVFWCPIGAVNYNDALEEWVLTSSSVPVSASNMREVLAIARIWQDCATLMERIHNWKDEDYVLL